MRGAGVARGVAREGRGARVLAVMRVQPSCSRECSRPLTAGSHCCRLRRLSRRKRALPLLAGRCAAGTRPVIAFAEFLHCALLPARAALAQPNVTPRKQISRLTALPLHVWGSVPLGRISAWSSLAALTYVRIGGCAGGAPPGGAVLHAGGAGHLRAPPVRRCVLPFERQSVQNRKKSVVFRVWCLRAYGSVRVCAGNKYRYMRCSAIGPIQTTENVRF